MAQSKLVIATLGLHPDAFSTSADATSLSGASMWVIFGAGLTRDQAAQLLEDAKFRVLDDIHTTVFPT